ncbi:MAG: hypothetical protein IKC12_01960 [Alistipes sp.]|nr:hypothetical protein [Alistipes sp.]
MSNKIILTFVGLVLSVATLSAQSAEAWIEALNNSLGTRYTMGATVRVEGDELTGIFMVDGDGYYLTLGTMEVYSDGKLRYEVNNERKEVTIDRVDLTSRDILTNPTNAFSFAAEEFYSDIVADKGAEVVISLVPREDIGITDIELTLRREGHGRVVPVAVRYNYDGDIIDVLLALRPADATLPRWDKAAYRAYDIVSFI